MFDPVNIAPVISLSRRRWLWVHLILCMFSHGSLYVMWVQGQELGANPRAALVIHWPAMFSGRQVRVEGDVHR